MLSHQTLVLNRSWLPIALTTVRRAVCLLASGLARAVNPHTFEAADWDGWVARGPATRGSLKGVGFDLPVPEVIVLNNYNGYPDVPVAFTRRNVYRRDGFSCVYCGATPPVGELTIDHVLPRSRSGGTSWQNCVTSCHPCNARKADRTPEEASMPLRTQPVAPHWPGGIDPRSLKERTSWHKFVKGERPQKRRAQAQARADRARRRVRG